MVFKAHRLLNRRTPLSTSITKLRRSRALLPMPSLREPPTLTYLTTFISETKVLCIDSPIYLSIYLSIYIPIYLSVYRLLYHSALGFRVMKRKKLSHLDGLKHENQKAKRHLSSMGVLLTLCHVPFDSLPGPLRCRSGSHKTQCQN